MKPFAPGGQNAARLAPAPRSYGPGRTSAPHQCGFLMLSTTLLHCGLRQCVNFGAQSRGPVLAVYASCRRYLRLRKTRLRLVVSLYRPCSLAEWVPSDSFNHRLPSIISPFYGLAWRERDLTPTPPFSHPLSSCKKRCSSYRFSHHVLSIFGSMEVSCS